MNFETIKNTWNGWSRKKKAIIVLATLVVLGGLSSKDDSTSKVSAPSTAPAVSQGAPVTPAQSETKAASESATKEWRSADGLNEAQWIARCQRYEAARQACAVADKTGQCMEIKLGVIDQANGDTYCENGKPNFFLMGRR